MGDGGAAVSIGAVIHTGDGDLLCGIPVGSGKRQGSRHSSHAFIVAAGADDDVDTRPGIEHDGVGGGVPGACGFGYCDSALGHGDAGGSLCNNRQCEDDREDQAEGSGEVPQVFRF